jgi:hypothetical protein
LKKLQAQQSNEPTEFKDKKDSDNGDGS